MTREPDSGPFDEARAAAQSVMDSPEGIDQGLAALREMAVVQLLYGQITNAKHFMTIALWIRPDDGRNLRVMAHVKSREGRALEAAKLLLAASESSEAKVKFRDWKEVGLALLRGHQFKLGSRFLKKSQDPVKA